jgi:hypothetical protein
MIRVVTVSMDIPAFWCYNICRLGRPNHASARATPPL